MAWPTIEIDSWVKFAALAAGLTSTPQNPRPQFIYRGQADESWPLKPKLLRYLHPLTTAQQALNIEESAQLLFQSEAHLHIPATSIPREFPPPALLEWWALMQHHGAPTRLLDWTYSPFVAAYFAVEQSPSTDAAVFLAHINTLGHSFAQAFHPIGIKNEQLRDPTISHHLAACMPPKRSVRLVAQQGLFTLSSHVLGDHGKLIEDSPPPGQNPHRKFIIPKELKTEMLAHLRTMGIGAHSLFPGIDGLGRSTAEIAIIGATQLALATTSKPDEHKPSTTTIPGNPSTDTATVYHDNSSSQGN